MSATIEADLFETYFKQPLKLKKLPRMRFKGRTFPVATYYLEDALELTGHEVRPAAEWCLNSEASRRRCVEMQTVLPTVVARADMARRFPERPDGVLDALRVLDVSIVNVDLIVQLIRYFVREERPGDAEERPGAMPSSATAASRHILPADGAVLVFLPGTAEINEVARAVAGMLARPDGRIRREWILPLHGALPPSEQVRCFARPPEGVCKVVLATNVAETSITIPDVALVIDSGRVKQTEYEPLRRMASLADVPVSAAQAKQRRGRAGRVQDGICFHLYPSDTELAAQTEPEVRRVSLERLVMSIKALKLPGSAPEVLSSLPEPPSEAAAAAALRDLALLGALSAHNEQLTPLGRVLVELPIEPRLAKLVLLGLCFGAPDETLTIAAALSSSRSPFLAPTDSMEARSMDALRRGLAQGTQSDHVAVLNAYRTYFLLPLGIDDRRGAFATRCILSEKVLESMRTLKAQLLGVLYDAKLITKNFRDLSFVEDFAFRKAAERSGVVASLSAAAVADGAEVSPASGPSTELLGMLLAAAFYPQLAVVDEEASAAGRRGRQGSTRASSLGRSASAGVELHIRDAVVAAAVDGSDDAYASDAMGTAGKATGKGKKAKAAAASSPFNTIALPMPMVARVHPASVGSRLNGTGWRSPYVAFHDCTRTRRLFVRDATPVPPLAPLLLGGEAIEAVDAATGNMDVILDGWLRVELSASSADLVLEASEQTRERWRRMIFAAAHGVYSPERRLAWASGRFDGLPLLEALQPLLEQRTLKLRPAKSAAGGGVEGKKAGRRGGPKPTRRRQRSRMARYRFDNRAGRYV